MANVYSDHRAIVEAKLALLYAIGTRMHVVEQADGSLETHIVWETPDMETTYHDGQALVAFLKQCEARGERPCPAGGCP